MTASTDRFGLSAAMTTPFRSDGAVDLAKLGDHARWCLENGCSSVTVFGTTGEGASIATSARGRILEALAAAGVEGRDVVFCMAASAVEEALDQGRLAHDFGCRSLLLTPPFYFKGVSDEGLFSWFSQVLEALGPAARGVILYNIPSVTQVGLSIELIGRLKQAFPGIVTGVKDSSGDWDYTQRLLAAHGDLAILIGDERYLAEGVRRGGQGAISGLANVCPGTLLPLARDGNGDERINRLVDDVLRHPVIPAVKTLVAHRTGDASWLTVRAPLATLPKAGQDRLCSAFDGLFAAKTH
ncbi:dihydrodipicolinate synthase family protein [Microvirga subterranea]|uniref:4-hydroxy-tetrahydrodipicolinate synthase n=1 Tax=Microvirga subterranea TaxID=186651 RepID=A0A370HM60_9HYPH|nr:dihydrodipicolinate synthase family protein [Microvirga subterranea]RDI59131.1 4-hydroxy-tetrahydrodipicolinate synthase [Microvirga subterranea]